MESAIWQGAPAVRDLALLIMLLTLAGLVWRIPWLGVLALAFLGYMHPQGYAEGFLQGAPLFAAFFALTLLALAFRQQEPWGRWFAGRLWLLRDWRVLVLIGFWLFTALTSSMALAPAAAWPKWIEFTKVVAAVGLMLLLIDDRRKLEALLLVIALAIGLVAVKGGYWALIHGAQERVYGSPSGHFYDNNAFAVANLMALPLLFHFWTTVNHRAARWLFGLMMVFSVIAVLSSWSRGGLLGLAATTLVLSLTGRRRAVAVSLLAGLALAVVALMPGAWMERMETITTPTQEGSAQSRLVYWETGLRLGAARPMMGWGFKSAYPLTERAEWHSSYVQVFAEHGVPGTLLWLSLLLGSIGLLARDVLRRRSERIDREGTALARALLASLVGYSVGGAFLSIAYWDILFQLIAVSVVLTRIGPGGQLDGADPKRQFSLQTGRIPMRQASETP